MLMLFLMPRRHYAATMSCHMLWWHIALWLRWAIYYFLLRDYFSALLPFIDCFAELFFLSMILSAIISMPTLLIIAIFINIYLRYYDCLLISYWLFMLWLFSLRHYLLFTLLPCFIYADIDYFRHYFFFAIDARFLLCFAAYAAAIFGYAITALIIFDAVSLKYAALLTCHWCRHVIGWCWCRCRCRYFAMLIFSFRRHIIIFDAMLIIFIAASSPDALRHAFDFFAFADAFFDWCLLYISWCHIIIY